jgi:hypothetical protein
VELAKKEFRSSIEPFFGKYCFVLAYSPYVEMELWLRLDGFSLDDRLCFSRGSGELVVVDLSAATKFEFGSAALAPPSMRGKFDKAMDAAASVLVEGTVRVTILLPTLEKKD